MPVAPFEITTVLSNTRAQLSVSTPPLAASCGERLWHAGGEAAVPELRSAKFSFRGSRGAELKGHAAFWGIRLRGPNRPCSLSLRDTRRLVRGPAGVRADMIFQYSLGAFRGHRPSGRPVHRAGAALFHFAAERIHELWVLGDLVGLDAWLKSNFESQPVILA